MRCVWNSLSLVGLLLIGCFGVRSLPAQEVLISEFMASNATTLTNAVGETHDWIELFNISTNDIDLGGWHLTDNAGDLQKWTFPSLVITSKQYMLVYASGSNTAWLAGELHANFKLSVGGEYLAIVRPGGSVIEHDYSPVFPEQSTDISYGLRPSSVSKVLVTESNTYRYDIPSDASDGTNWVLNGGFDDSSWMSASGPIGYERTSFDYGSIFNEVVPDLTQTIYQRSQFVLAPGDQFEILTFFAKYDDGFVVFINGEKSLIINSPVSPDFDDPASSERDNADAVFFDDFSMNAAAGLLKPGTNTLAVHVLNENNSAFFSDLLMSFELHAEDILPDLSGERRYFHVPTPGQANLLGEEDFLKAVDFDHARGYYTNPLALTLSMNLEEFDIWYTLDGTQPATNNGILYAGPFAVGTTTVVRARGFRDGFEPSPYETHTYLFVEDIVRQANINQTMVNDPVDGPKVRESLQGLPTLVLSSGYDNFFGPINGIYSHPNNRGFAWERPCSAELINVDGGTEFAVNCGVRLYGGAGRGSNKKSFRLLFKGIYGPTKLNYELFPEEGAADKFDTINLRAGFNDRFYANGLRDSYVRRTQIALAGHGSRSTFVHLFIDDVYWGIYNPSERPDGNFGATYFGGDSDLWDGINANKPTGESLTTTWNAMKSAVAAGMANVVNYQNVLGNFADGTRDPSRVIHLNVDNHIDYMMAHLWAGTGDWPGHNWYANGARTNSVGWGYFCWDAEFSLSSLTANNSTTLGPNSIHGSLMQSPEYLLHFADHVRRHFFNDGELTPAKCVARYGQLVDEVRPGTHINNSRWGGSPGGWENTQASLLGNYMVNRPAIVLDQLRNVGLYTAIDAPEFNVYGGTVSNAFALVITSSNAVYYTLDGTDPREIGGAIFGSPYVGPLPITNNELVKARARRGDGVWSALTEAFFSHASVTGVQVSELMPEPRGPTNLYVASEYEYIELYNPGLAAINLQHVSFTEGVSFSFPSVVINPGAYLVVAANTNAFVERYGAGGITLAGEYDGSLNNNGERIELRSGEAGARLLAFTYDNGRDWHLPAQGGGHSLVPSLSLDQNADELDHGSSWRASTYRDGSPGVVDPAAITDIVINEIVAHTDYSNAAMPEFDSNDAIELFNKTGGTISFTNWYLSDDVNELTKWPIPPALSVDGGGWLAFDEVTGFHNPTNTGFGLNKAGEMALVSYLPGTAQDRIADAIRFKAQEQGFSLGRYPDGDAAWFRMLPTTNAANALPSSRVIISELMYHPSEALEASAGVDLEYIELYNGAGVPVNLWNEAGNWRISGGITFNFPTNVTLPVNAYLLLVPFDPSDLTSLNAFMSAYGDTNLPALVMGPLNGQLSNEGERIALELPVAPDQPGEAVSWSIVDEVIYFDSVSWPAEADGGGVPLQRVSNGGDGNLPATWTGSLTASPGRARDKIGMTEPILGEIFFVPATLPLTAIIDDQQIVGVLEKVEFLLDGSVIGVVTQAPYEFVFSGITNSGMVEASSRIVDDGGTNTSAEVQVEYLLLETLGADFITDQAARLNGSLAGNVSGDITYYWGKSDGETNASAWDHSGLVGAVSPGPFLAEVGSLDAGSVYYARAYGEGGANSGWSMESQTFSTMAFNQWSNSMSIRFPGYTSSEVLDEFTVLVILSTNITGFSYDDFRPDVSDLRFATTNGVGLNYEIESWDPLGSSYVWVGLSSLSTQEQSIVAYWGNANSLRASTYVSGGGAWDDDYRGVWHMNSHFVDSTDIGVIGIVNGASNTAGVASGGLKFDGVDDHVDPRIFNDWYGDNIAALTVSLWVKPYSGTPGHPFGADDPSDTGELMIQAVLGGQWIYSVGNRSKIVHSLDVGDWQMLTIVLDDYQALGYWNDDPADIIGVYTQFVPVDIPFLGKLNMGIGSEFAGDADELRVSGVARSQAWVGATYRTVADNDSFTTYEMLNDVDPDFDNDGLPDAWEREHFGGEGVSDGGSDADMDGLSDTGEFIAGTIPTNANDFFFLYTGNSGSDADVRFDMIPAAGPYYVDLSRFYALEGAVGPGSNQWQSLEGATNIPAIAGPFIYTNFLASTNAVYFYRGKVWLQSSVTN